MLSQAQCMDFDPEHGQQVGHHQCSCDQRQGHGKVHACPCGRHWGHPVIKLKPTRHAGPKLRGVPRKPTNALI